MAEWFLLPKTLNYGRKSATNATWLTLIVILALTATIYMLFKCQAIICKPCEKGKRVKRPVGQKAKSKFILRMMPGVAGLLLVIVGMWWVIGKGITLSSPNWQADFFMGFFFTMFLWIMLAFYQSILKLRRTVSWFILNGMFKTFSVIFAGMALAPYYVYTTSQEAKFWESPLSCASFFIFLTYVLISLYVFRASPFSSLIPMVVLWGSAISYYTTWYALQYAIMWNGSSIIVAVLGVLGISSFFGGIDRHVRGGASPQFMFAYCVIMFIIIAGFWNFFWAYYDVPIFGTDYEIYHSSSFYR